MKLKIAINGFGRIGKCFLRVILSDKKALDQLEIAAINIGPAEIDSVAHVFKFDTTMGTYPSEVFVRDKKLIVDNYEIPLIAETDPLKIDWKKFEIDWVVESSGFFTKKEDSMKHIKSGAKKVLITAPAKNEDVTIIPGINDKSYNPEKDQIVSLGSCTTNALATMLKVLNDYYKIKMAFMTTIHSYTNSQVILDSFHKDLRRARTAASNIIPTTTGATKVIGKVIPELDGLIFGTAVRVPVENISLIDLVVHTEKELSIQSINESYKKSSRNELRDILDINYLPLVSRDYYKNSFSVTIDGLSTIARGNMGQVFGWYDNEWGYCCRLKDFILHAKQ
jgi:glyceraldehyde 3-phosphate dehydrogenase